jgi:catechol 2,3-dioxygenase-like lactoylglutathione lyase family enzyme
MTVGGNGEGRPERLSAVTLVTSDMARSTEFYQRLGFQRLYGGPDAEFTSFSVGPSYLNLQRQPSRPAGASSWGRVIVYVDDVDAMYRRVRGAGYSAAMSPSDAPWGERYFHVRDPDGHEISFARPLEP